MYWVCGASSGKPQSQIALRRVAREDRFADARAGLLIRDIVDVPDAPYRALLDYEAEAARLGYAVLA